MIAVCHADRLQDGLTVRAASKSAVHQAVRVTRRVLID